MFEAACIRAGEAALLWAHMRPDGSQWWSVLLHRGLDGVFTELLAHASNWSAAWLGWQDSVAHNWALQQAVEIAGCQVESYFVLIIRLKL